jgi:protein-tyrosine kinase
MSAIERALKAAAKRKKGELEPMRSRLTGAARELASGLFKDIAKIGLKPKVMEQNRILPAIHDRGAITAYKMLRTRILHRMRSNHWQNMIVTSAGPGEGKTLTASNLAFSMSSDVNQSVVLVDLDLQRPSVATYFGIDPKATICDFLRGDAAIEEIVYAPQGMDRIAIIPGGAPVENSSDLISSPRMGELLDWLKARGPTTITIFDMPPVLACDDVLAFLPSVDALLLVVAEGQTDRQALTRTTELLGECNLLGVVLNQSRERNAVSAYYY